MLALDDLRERDGAGVMRERMKKKDSQGEKTLQRNARRNGVK